MLKPDEKIMKQGMECLIKELGIVEAQRFISLIIRQSDFDYTEWQRAHFDNMTPEEISREAVEYEEAHPFDGDAVIL